MAYKLFLDDERKPWDCLGYMASRIGPRTPIYLETGWVVCKNYGCFVATILDMGLPDFVSFDHDLAEEHYTPSSYWDSFEKSKEYQSAIWDNYKEKTGYECAKWLCDYCFDNGFQIPEFAVHSMNPVGAERIFSLLTRYKSELNDRKRV